MVGVNSMNSSPEKGVVLVLNDAALVLRVSKRCRCILPYTCSNQTTLISYLVFFLPGFLLHAIYSILLSRFLFAPYLCFLFRPPLYSRFVVQLPSSRCNVFPVCFFKFSFLLTCLSSSRYMFHIIVSLPICSLPLFPFQASAILSFCCTASFLKIFTGLLLKASAFLCTGLRKMKLYFMPFSTHILLISLWRKLIRKICVEKSMKLSGVSFPASSLEDSPRIVGTNIVFFSQGDMFVPEDVNLFYFFFKASVFSRFCSTGLLLKPSGFLCIGLRNMKLYFMPFFTHILLISLWRKLIRNSQDMRTESMKLWDDSPTIVGTNIVYFSQGEDFIFFPFSFSFFTRQVVTCIYVLFRFSFVAEVYLASSNSNDANYYRNNIRDVGWFSKTAAMMPAIAGTASEGSVRTIEGHIKPNKIVMTGLRYILLLPTPMMPIITETTSENIDKNAWTGLLRLKCWDVKTIEQTRPYVHDRDSTSAYLQTLDTQG
ncbi:hypothetical protein LXL04_034154 [Taraxacum kok-saghyz]